MIKYAIVTFSLQLDSMVNVVATTKRLIEMEQFVVINMTSFTTLVFKTQFSKVRTVTICSNFFYILAVDTLAIDTAMPKISPVSLQMLPMDAMHGFEHDNNDFMAIEQLFQKVAVRKEFVFILSHQNYSCHKKAAPLKDSHQRKSGLCENDDSCLATNDLMCKDAMSSDNVFYIYSCSNSTYYAKYQLSQEYQADVISIAATFVNAYVTSIIRLYNVQWMNITQV